MSRYNGGNMAQEEVNILESGRAAVLLVVRATVAAIAAGAGALGTAAIGADELAAGQYWAALGSAAAAFGAVIGVPQGSVKAYTTKGETEQLRNVRKWERENEE